MAKLTRTDLQQLAKDRIADAEVLLKADRFSGVYYLTGLAVECALKACIAKSTEQYEFPDKDRALDSWKHDLGKLVNTAGLTEALSIELKVAEFEANWLTVKDWDVASRYLQSNELAAKDMFQAASEPKYGIIPWIGKHW